MNYDVTWDIFDVFSKIRMAFFRSLLESLHRNGDTFKNEFSSQGYMLIATVPKNEGASAVELLQHEVTLLHCQ